MRSDDASAAIAAGVVALPFAIIFALLLLHIEPPLGPLESILTGEVDKPNVLGSAIVFGAWLLSVVAVLFAVAPIVRGMSPAGSASLIATNAKRGELELNVIQRNGLLLAIAAS